MGIGAGGPHTANEIWELDRGCDSVLWCGPQRCGPPVGVDLRCVDLPEVSTSVLILHTLNVASTLLQA
jgi:hypothetical protein